MKLHSVATVFMVFTVVSASSTASAASLDVSKPFLCAVNTIMECDSSGQCVRYTAEKHPDFPAFLRVNLGERTISNGSSVERPATTEIKALTRLDGRVILHGGENGRGWAATIAESSGHMSAGIVADAYTFALFGACTTP